MKTTVDFYLGGNSPSGFSSFYSELEVPIRASRSYLIKGGAGTGKSSIMKRVSEECGEGLVELIHCSSDPNSLDGIIFGGVSMLDATPPHVIEPKYPGAYQTVVNLCEYFNEHMLEKNLPDIITYQAQNNACHRKCCRKLKAADALLEDSRDIVRDCTDLAKVNLCSERIIKKHLKPKGGTGIEHKRLLSAITNRGVLGFPGTAPSLARNLYLIKDEYGVSSSCMLTAIRSAAMAGGYEFYCCYCPMEQQNRVEHIFIPELSLGFVTQSSYIKFNINPISVISYTRFTDMKKLGLRKQLLAFNKLMSGKLIASAVDELRLAKDIHDRLEEQYTPAVNFLAVAQKTDEIIGKINMTY